MSETSKAKQVFEPGCYFDGARGCYMVDAIVDFAETYGFRPAHECECEDHKYNPNCAWSECEWANEVEDDATAFMEDNYPQDGATWGRSESGDWGLWPIEDDAI